MGAYYSGINRVAIIAILLAIAGCAPPAPPVETHVETTGLDESAHTFRVEVWADNWFAFFVDGTPVYEDTVPITTERSFNAEVFTFTGTYPLQLSFVVRDFIENDTGLEYIGSRRQQMGDGGFIAQVTDVDTNEIVAVTDTSWKSLVTHHAPVDAACVDLENPIPGEGPCANRIIDEPAQWTILDFEDSAWAPAVEHSVSAVRPKDGYDTIDWDPSAQIIWSADLEKDNTILLRKTIGASTD